MNKKELLERLKQVEGHNFEVKKAEREVPKDVWKTVSAFANTHGGTIVFGITEVGDGTFEITGVQNVEKVQNDFISTLRGERFNIPLSSKGHLFDFEGKKVILFNISEMPENCKPVYYGGDIRNTYTRQGSGDHRCSKEELNRMLRNASERSSDSMILTGYTADDIDVETITVYKKYLSFKNPESPFLLMEGLDFLRKLGCLAIDRERGNKEELTMAGLLLFGKEDSIRERFPAYELDIYLIPDIDRVAEGVRWQDRKIYEVNLINTYLEAIRYLKTKIEIPFVVTGEYVGRTEEVPTVMALREALVNMLIHRDYFENGQSRIKIYRNGIEMFNPGAAPKTVKEIIEDEVTEPRNPIIAKIFRLIGWSEIAGSGMMKIFKYWDATGYREPEIENNPVSYFFKMYFPFTEKGVLYDVSQKSIITEPLGENIYGKDIPGEIETDIKDEPINRTLNEVEKSILTIIEAHGQITPKELSNLIKKGKSTIYRYLKRLEDFGLVKMVRSDKKRKWEKVDAENVVLNETEKNILAIIRERKKVSYKELSDLLKKGKPTIYRYLGKLKKLNLIESVASNNKNGYWEIVE